MPPPQPDLPSPAHPTVDSMLSRKFGKEIANYFSGSPLNRVSFLRGDTSFLRAALKHPSARFVLLNSLNPLVQSEGPLVYATYEDVKPILGENFYEKSEDDIIKEYNSSSYVPQVVFLGLDGRKPDFSWKEHYKGAPFFSVDVTPKLSVKDEAEKLIARLTEKGNTFSQQRIHLTLSAEEAAIFAEARHLTDWNGRNPFCASCGYPTMSVQGGFKRTCPPRDLASALTEGKDAPSDRPPCVTRTGISNLCFPRTDPTVIMAVVSADGSRVLLGRQKRYPPQWYSTLAGFLEPAESVEEAVRREVWEESGIYLGRVVIHSTQPWPYPANLMIGAIGQAIPGGEEINLGHDAELEDAKWFSRDEIQEALNIGTSGLGDPPGEQYKGGLRLPPKTAIAHQLISAAIGTFVRGDGNDSKI